MTFLWHFVGDGPLLRSLVARLHDAIRAEPPELSAEYSLTRSVV